MIAIQNWSTYELLSFPSEAPVITFIAVAEVNPTSGSSRVIDAVKFCMLITTSG